jgi:hypothetical protein
MSIGLYTKLPALSAEFRIDFEGGSLCEFSAFWTGMIADTILPMFPLRDAGQSIELARRKT